MNKEYLVSASEMKQLDYNTIKKTGLPSLVLMERAALAVAQSVMDYLNGNNKKRILVIAGNGNNGADGVCAGRILKEYGYDVEICVLKSKHEYTEEMKVQLDAATKYDINIIPEENIIIEAYDVVIDSIFGIGLNRNIEGTVAQLIDRINQSDVYVISVDIPSGINASNGAICATAIKADETITFGFYKCGQMLYPGRLYCGNIKKAKIAINETSFYGMNPEMFTYLPMIDEEKIAFPRSCMGNKGTFGKVLVIAGRASTAGAALLCAESALRSGCGMVAVLTEAENRDAFLTSLPEAMLETYAHDETMDSVTEKINKWLAWADVVVMGCGLGKDETAYHIVSTVIEACDKPLVCDADALQLLALHEELRVKLHEKNKDMGRKTVFTPHPGELASLLHCDIADIKADRILTAKKACEEYGSIMVAKDADTLCVSEEEAVYLNTSGNDGLSTAGSGDVLAGLTASVIAQSLKIDMNIFEAVCLSVFIHGYAADYLAKKNGKRFLVASDITKAYKYILE